MSRYASSDTKARRERRQQGRWVPNILDRVTWELARNLHDLWMLTVGFIAGAGVVLSWAVWR